MWKCVARDCYKVTPVVIDFCWFKIHVIAPFVFFDECKLQTRKFFATSRLFWKKHKNFYTGKTPLSNCNRYSKTQTGRFLTCLKNFFNLLHNSILQHLTKKREWAEIGFVWFFWRFQGVKSYSKRTEKGVLEHKKRTAQGNAAQNKTERKNTRNI